MTYNYIIWITKTEIFLKPAYHLPNYIFGVSISICEIFKAKSYSSTECAKLLS